MIEAPKRRRPGSRFQPSQRRNRGGEIRNVKASMALMDISQQAREYGREALEKLVQLMRGVITVDEESHEVPVQTQGWAAAEIVTRGWGRAAQSVEVAVAVERIVQHLGRDDLTEVIESRLTAIRERLREDDLHVQ